jgi:hypothetical protein
VEPTSGAAYSRAMIRHIFLWNVKPEAGPDAGQRILDTLSRLKDGPVLLSRGAPSAENP